MNYQSHDFEAIGEDGKLAVPHDVQDAIRTLLRWAGDDPDREGLLDTPARVGRAWREYCGGYREDPGLHLSRTFCPSSCCAALARSKPQSAVSFIVSRMRASASVGIVAW